MLGLIQNVARRVVTSNDEPRNLQMLLGPMPRDARVLDVGCGFGEKLRQLDALGFHQVPGGDRRQNLGDEVLSGCDWTGGS